MRTVASYPNYLQKMKRILNVPSRISLRPKLTFLRSSYPRYQHNDERISKLKRRVTELEDRVASLNILVQEEELLRQVEILADYDPTPISLSQFISVSPRALIPVSAAFLRKELPIRFALCINQFDSLPSGLAWMPSIRALRQWYVRSMTAVLDHPHPSDPAAVDSFTELLRVLYRRHRVVLIAIAKGLTELRHDGRNTDFGDALLDGGGPIAEPAPKPDISTLRGARLVRHALPRSLERAAVDVALNKLLLGRIGIRFLIGQHLEMYDQVATEDRPVGYIGLVSRKVDAMDVASRAIESASRMCVDYYGVAPSVKLVVHGRSVPFVGVPGHIWFILVELLKNSFRAVIEQHNPQLCGGIDPQDAGIETSQLMLPSDSITVEINNLGTETIDLVVRDKGGGMSRPVYDVVDSYLFTTGRLDEADSTRIDEAIADCSNGKSSNSDLMEQGGWFVTGKLPLGGFGFGIPVARLFTQYFGGCLRLVRHGSYVCVCVCTRFCMFLRTPRPQAPPPSPDAQQASADGEGTSAYVHLRRYGGTAYSLNAAKENFDSRPNYW